MILRLEKEDSSVCGDGFVSKNLVGAILRVTRDL